MTMGEEEATLIIQREVRGWLVRKRENIQEMRQKWKVRLKQIHKIELVSEVKCNKD